MTAQSSEATYSIADIDRELIRRQEEEVRNGRTQETLENERDVKRARLGEINLELPYAGDRAAKLRLEKTSLEEGEKQLTAHIERTISSIAENKRVIFTLRAYKKALQLVAQGIPKGIIRG